MLLEGRIGEDFQGGEVDDLVAPFETIEAEMNNKHLQGWIERCRNTIQRSPGSSWTRFWATWGDPRIADLCGQRRTNAEHAATGRKRQPDETNVV